MQLNAAQLKAVQHVNGPMMVIAGPGSGKTAVLTRRIQWMIEQAHVQPGSILVITFTRAAAQEMQSRFLKLMKQTETDVTFGTFHSVFYSILRERLGNELRLVESQEAQKWVTEYIIKKIQCDRMEAQWRAFFILSEYSRLLNTGTYAKQRLDESMGQGVFEDVVLYYREMKRIQGCIDFDDMLMQLKELLETDRELLDRCRKQYQYILVDEFQDINRVQYEILCLLAEPVRNIFVVGDDDQAIYGFRGSQPEYLLQFPAQFPESQRVDLGINYRCRAEIVNMSAQLIRYNQKRYQKQFQSGIKGKGYIHCWKVLDEEREANRICDVLREYHKELPYEEMAVLFRTHTQSQKLIEKMRVWGIPFQYADEGMDPFSSEIAETFHRFLRYAEKRENTDLEKIWEIVAAAIPHYYVKDNLNMKDPRLSADQIIKLEEIKRQFDKLAGKRLAASILYVWNQMGYKQYLKQQCEKEGMPWPAMKAHFTEILKNAENIKSKEVWMQREKKQHTGGVHLMTMHGAKGLEFTAVIIMDATEGICPYEYAVTEDAIEEERRIFYVALTRAKKYIDIFYTVKGRRRQKESRFLRELKY